MSLTIATIDQRRTPYPDEPPMPEERRGELQPSVERWLQVMYGIRPNPTVRATFVPMTHPYAGGVAEWLEALWGIGPGRSYPSV